MSQNDKLISISGFQRALSNIKTWVTGFAAQRNHTHYNIDNDFTVTTSDNTDEASISVTSDSGVSISATGDSWMYDTSLNVKDTGVDVYINDNEMMESTSITTDSNSVSIDSSSIYLTSNADYLYKHINIGDNIDIGCYYEDMDYIKGDAIRIDGHNGVEITSSVEDEYKQNQSSILNKSGEINITTYAHYDNGMDSYYDNDTDILLRKTETNDSEIVISASKTSHHDNDDGESIYNNASGEITINAGSEQSNIELSADNIIIKSNSNSAPNKVFTTNGGIATLPTALKNPHSLTIQGNGTTIDSYNGASAKTINITPAGIGADTKPFSTIRDFENGTLIKTNIDYSVSSGAPFYVEIKGNTYVSIGSMFIQAQGYIYNDTIINYSVTSLGVIYPEQFIAINVDGYLCFWFPRIAYWHGYSIKVTTGYDYSTNCVVDVIDSVEPAGTKRVVLSDNYFINHGFDGGNGNGGDADTVDGKHASDFAVANHNHTMILNGSFTPEITATYDNGTLIISGNVSEVQYTGTTDVENTNANPESWFVETDDIRALFANEVGSTDTL